jgi:hypothetical protein
MNSHSPAALADVDMVIIIAETDRSSGRTGAILSVTPGIIDCMFEHMFDSADDTALVAAIVEWNAAEAAAAAHKLAAVAELTRRRCAEGERADWSCDDWDSAAAEVSSALGVGHSRASGQMHLALALRLRLPRVAEVFLRGALSPRVVAALVWRTALVLDPEALAAIDEALAGQADRWEALSQYKLEQAIDVWLDRIDPGALRRTRYSVRGRDVSVGSASPESGTASLWGRLLASDALLLERRLSEMAHALCDDDPRTAGQRRADALGALAAGAQYLTCQCDNEDCPSSTPDGRADNVVIHVLADADALTAEPDPQMSGEPSAADDSTLSAPGSAALMGGGAVPTPLLAELIRDCAKVRHLRRPPDAAEPQYRPSTALDEFIRLRDLTCRFPNCNKPAEFCDIDHAIPWPFGPTHPSNLRAECRKHHLLKTFWTGPGGWSDVQYPDGTIAWTSPTGQTYTTHPGSRLLFPRWNTTTARLPKLSSPDRDRGLMMPIRRRTRAADLARRIIRERALNDAHVAERNRPPPF